MNSSTPLKELLRPTSTADKLNLFQFLFDARELTADLTLALLKVIHEDLNNHQKPDRTVFRRYAELVASLRYHVPEMFQQVLDGWKAPQSAMPEEWFSDNTAQG